MRQEEPRSSPSTKTIIGIVLIPLALVGICCGGLLTVAGIGKRFLFSEDSSESPSVQATIKVSPPQGPKEAPPRPSPAPKSSLSGASNTNTLSYLEAAALGDMSIHIKALGFSPVNLRDNDNRFQVPTDERYMWFHLHIQNTSRTRKYDYSTWGGSPTGILDLGNGVATLKDDCGNSYATITFRRNVQLVGRTSRATLYPGSSIEDLLVFEAPVAAAKSFLLRLPGEALEQKGDVRFSIPHSAIH